MGYAQSRHNAAVNQIRQLKDAPNFRPHYFRSAAVAAVVLMGVSAHPLQENTSAPRTRDDFGPRVGEVGGKPGLRAFLQQLLGQYGGKSKATPPVMLYSQQELLAAARVPKSKPLLVLVRPDFVVAGSDLAALKRANAEINRGAGK